MKEHMGFTVCPSTLHVGKSCEFSHEFGCAGPAYRYLGCYSDPGGPYSGRTLPQGLNGRTGVGVDECAAAARSRGFPLFALQEYGQCFFGSMADIKRNQAWQILSDASCNDLPCPTSATTCRTATNKVFLLIGTIYLGYPVHSRFANSWTLPPRQHMDFRPSPEHCTPLVHK
jgi:hypothetical protein